MGKKKKGDKEKKAKKKPAVNERDIVFYEQQILDNNRQLARLRTRNEQLEGEADSLKGQLSRLENDRSDVVAHLKRILQQKTEEARELGERLLAMEELRKEEKASFKNKEESMLQEYHNMETNLNAEVKLVSGKLNALEDWRNARAELTRRFEIQEEEMAEQEKRHEKSLYEAEKSLVIGKAQMQREMQERLNDLALSFQKATNLRMADATQRAIRENIALNIELDETYRAYEKLENKIQICKEKEENSRLRGSLLQEEARIALNKVFEQNRVIEKIAEDHLHAAWLFTDEERMKGCIASKNEMIQALRMRHASVTSKAEEVPKNISMLEQNEIDISKEVKINQTRSKELSKILASVKVSITQLLQEAESTHQSASKVINDSDFTAKLREIYNVLEDHNIPNFLNN